MVLLKKISHFVLYGFFFALISGIVSLLTSDDYSLAPNEAFADVPSGGGTTNDGSSGCGCAGCGAGGSCGSGCAGSAGCSDSDSDG